MSFILLSDPVLWMTTFNYEDIPLPLTLLSGYRSSRPKSNAMKRIATNLSISLLTFACGFSVASVWNQSDVKTEQANVTESFATLAPSAVPVITPTPDREVVFGHGRLRMVPEEVHLKSERLQYEIDVTFPQIVGSKNRHISKLNQRIKQLATNRYLWMLNSSKEDLQHYRKDHPEVFNSLEVHYEVDLATDSVLSIHFNGYEYGIGAAHGSQFSFVINYDLASGKELKLARLFKPGSKYLEFISRYCSDALSLDRDRALEFTKDPESWNITRNGLRFTFDHCKFFACSEGSKAVEIPFAALKEILNTEFKF